MTNYERIKAMSIEEVAQCIIDNAITDEYYKSDCDADDCPHELECCVKWLEEESEDDI